MGDAWTNHGSIEAEDSGQLVLGDPGHSFQNLGTITATDADVRLNGDFVIADLGTFDFINSLVAIEGTLLNDAGLVLDAGRFNWKLGRGTVLGGTISSADGTTFGIVAGGFSSFATGCTWGARTSRGVPRRRSKPASS